MSAVCSRRALLGASGVLLAGCSSSPSVTPSQSPLGSPSASPPSAAATPHTGSADAESSGSTGDTTTAAPATPTGRDGLVAALRAGGVALYLRHPATDRGGVDDARAPRSQQRLLSPEGQQQARDLGAALRAHSVTAGRILTSPSWRCRDAATIAFGRGEVDWGIQALLQDTATRDERADYARDLLSRSIPRGQVLVLIGHSSNISAATGERVAEGAGVVTRPDGRGSYAAIGTLTPADWAALAEPTSNG